MASGAQALIDDRDRHSILPRDVGTGDLYLQYQELGNMSRGLRSVAAELSSVLGGTGGSATVDGTTSSTPRLRDGSLGLGSNGAFPEWSAMVGSFSHVLRDSATHLEGAADHLDVFVKDAKQRDGDANTALRASTRRINEALAPRPAPPVRTGRGD